MGKPKNPRPKCPRCKCAMRYISIRNYNDTKTIGVYCPECNRAKLKPDIKLIQRDIFIGLNKF